MRTTVYFLLHEPLVVGLSAEFRAPLPLVIESANDTLAGPSDTEPHQQQYGDEDEAEDDAESATAGLDPKRLRNRTAAMKCRLKKIELTNEMRERLKATTAENEQMTAQAAKLKHSLSAMNSILQAHLSNGSCKISLNQRTED